MRLTLKKQSEYGMFCPGARQFVENHFADTTIGRIRLLVDATFRRVRHLAEKKSQVRHSVEIVKSLFFDQTSYSTERRIYQMPLIIKKENHKKSLCVPDVQLIKARSNNFLKLIRSWLVYLVSFNSIRPIISV